MIKYALVGIAMSSAVLLTVACSSTNGDSGGDSSGDAGNGPALPLSNQGADFVAACEAQAKSNCALYQKCSPIAYRVLYADTSDCVAQTAHVCEYYGKYPEVAVSASTVNACAATLASGDCEKLYQPYPCGVPKGPRQLGAGCAVNAQCASGLCLLSSLECGVCTAPFGPGEACVTQNCDDAQGLQCINGHCIVPATAGLSCSSGTCADGLICVNGTCDTGGAMGDSCSQEVPCNYHLGLGCDLSSGTCTTATFGAPGQSCQVGGSQFCSDGLCVSGLGDGGTGGCSPLVPAQGTCNSSTSFCEPSLFCISGKCDDLPASASCH